MGLAVLFGTLPFGVIIMCWGRVLYCGIELFINMYYTNRIVKISSKQQLQYIIPFLGYCVAVVAICILFQPCITNDIVKLFVNFLVIVFFWWFVVQKVEKLYLKDYLLLH